MVKLLDGKALAGKLLVDLKDKTQAFIASGGPKPGLAAVLVGEDPASALYVKNKISRTLEAGMASFEHRLPATTSQDELLALITELNHDPAVHGILVQLPLPPSINPLAVINAIDPDKDVDGFHVINAGRLVTGQEGFVPSTPLGCLLLIQEALPRLGGKHAVILGRSNIVGKPLAHLLLREDCTVTLAHSKSRHPAEIARNADILVAAVGRPELVRADWVKPGAVVIDVGINRLPGEGSDKKGRLVGDVAFAEVEPVAGAITPVPGGVGPMTIACLIANTLKAAQKNR